MLTDRNGQTRAGYRRCTRCKNWTQCECGANSTNERQRRAQEQRAAEDREDQEMEAWLRRYGRHPDQQIPNQWRSSKKLRDAVEKLRK
jgi:hypothetical protein